MSDNKPPSGPPNKQTTTKDTTTSTQQQQQQQTDTTPQNNANSDNGHVGNSPRSQSGDLGGDVIRDGEVGEKEMEEGRMGEGRMGQAEPLSHNLAVIEEQFRRGFDLRYCVTQQSAVHRSLFEDPEETMRTNKVFREVSRLLGGEWKKLYADLMKNHTQEVIDKELTKISRNQAIIQGYRSLVSWKEVSGGGAFSLMTLVQSLNDLGLIDIADLVLHIIDNNEVPTTKPAITRKRGDLLTQTKATTLDNNKLLLLSKRIGGEYEGLGRELGVVEEELEDIKKDEGQTYQGCFKVLWAWKDARAGEGELEDTEVLEDTEALKAAMLRCGLEEIAGQVDVLCGVKAAVASS